MIKLVYNHPKEGRKPVYLPRDWGISFEPHRDGCYLDLYTGNKIISLATSNTQEELEKMIDEALK